jgi:hypothetical protein
MRPVKHELHLSAVNKNRIWVAQFFKPVKIVYDCPILWGTRRRIGCNERVPQFWKAVAKTFQLRQSVTAGKSGLQRHLDSVVKKVTKNRYEPMNCCCPPSDEVLHRQSCEMQAYVVSTRRGHDLATPNVRFRTRG